ncbi:MAG: NADH-quinone oxidoreductase subunit C [Cytophagaceae bacterium]
MTDKIKEILTGKFGVSVVIREDNPGTQAQIVVLKDKIADICDELWRNEITYFDFLSCITCIDNLKEQKFEVIYNLYSIPYNLTCVLKVEVGRNNEVDSLPAVPSVTPVYKSANWHEREIYDMFGVLFTGHPDMRRILLPADWEGFPLRKDYKQQEYYHGIKVEY